ncbi:MAG: hypothetical protein JWP63_2440, partial [Candidatus Solibacter sp.]|nr:hypothetical protein [Candidatus Solibacter sp.]
MLREKLIEHHRPGAFRWRGSEIARIEGLSDAVFAFAVTLLVVSLEVPKTFNELTTLMSGFAPFAICFAMLMQVWHEQFIFFRRYNLQDTPTIILNCCLLFVVLFYVYPLKFLFTVLVREWTGAGIIVQLANGTTEKMVEPHQIHNLMAIFSAGYLAVSFVFLLLFLRALNRRIPLDLDPIEVFETRVSIGASLINMGVGTASVAVALTGRGDLAGIIYP